MRVKGLGALLDSARASQDAADFGHRLASPGLLSKKSLQHVKHIREIIRQGMDAPLSDESLWSLLRAIHLLSFDLATSTNQTEAWIKTMLAHAANGHDKQALAAQTWTELVDFAGRKMPAAASIAFNDLPESARARHTPIAEPALQAFARLREHSRTVLRGIRTTIAHVKELPRDEPVAELLDQLAEGRAVLVTGPAGFGKSALAKLCVEPLATDSIILAFRAEEFATAHLDESLHNSQIGAGSEELFALLSGQGRKVMLVESVERLLESSQREAFLDLLRLVRDDPSWRLVVTCRDYSLETVRAAFVEQAGLRSCVFAVPELTDEELREVTDAIPALRRPAASPFLNQLFRNPYYLDKAAAMSWPAASSLPASERAFRDQFWRDVVRQDDHTRGGMPKRREQAFMEICVRRARALEPYVGCDDLDPEVVGRLHADNLVAYAGQSDRLAAPAHDALEDWAVLRWIGAAYDLAKPSHADFSVKLGSFPAVRRAYRKWVTELVDVSPVVATDYVTGVFMDPDLPTYFRDDTLVSVLLSPVAPDFLSRAKAVVADDDCSFLRRIMHLTRVACKAVPPGIPPVGEARALCFVPSGPAWASVLRLVRQHLASLIAADLGLVVGLLRAYPNNPAQRYVIMAQTR